MAVSKFSPASRADGEAGGSTLSSGAASRKFIDTTDDVVIQIGKTATRLRDILAIFYTEIDIHAHSSSSTSRYVGGTRKVR